MKNFRKLILSTNRNNLRLFFSLLIVALFVVTSLLLRQTAAQMQTAEQFSINGVPTPMPLNLTVTRNDDRNDVCVSGDCSLREAVNAANASGGDDTINFAPDLTTITLTGVISISNAGTLTINGLGANNLTIDGALINSIFGINATVTISGMTLTRGVGVIGRGGAIAASGGSLTLDGVHVTGNSANNSELGGGGGMLLRGGTHRIINSTISANTSRGCAGIVNSSGSTLTIVNSTISGNDGRGVGGLCNEGNATLRNVTITNNSAGFGGGGIDNNGTLDFGNTIVAGNTSGLSGPEISFDSGTITSAGGNLVGDSPGDSTNTGPFAITYQPTDIRDVNPMLGILQNNGGTTPTHALLAVSPAIDTGLNALAVDPSNGNAALVFDQRGAGFPRIVDGNSDGTATVDIGAFEVQPTSKGIVSGRVTYANALTTTAVPFTTINAAGSIPLSTMTDSNGDYSLSGFGSGAYVIIPSKTNQVNGISNLDASRVAQHIVGLTTLNANQLIAADTTGNGAVSSLDAAYIAQFVALIPNPGTTGRWKFLPESRSYPDLLTNQNNQDYSAILVGDVTGNWNPAGALGFDLSTVESEQPRQTEKAAKGEGVTVTAQWNESAGEETAMTLNLTATETTGKGILGYQFDVLYDAAVIEPQAVSCDVSDTISRGMTAICQAGKSGVLKVVVFGATPMSGEGILLKLKFNVVGARNSASPLRIENFMFNEDSPQEVTIDGQVLVGDSRSETISIGRQLFTAVGQPTR